MFVTGVKVLKILAHTDLTVTAIPKFGGQDT